MRYRITVHGDGMLLRGHAEFQNIADLGAFATAMLPYGVVIASNAEHDEEHDHE